MILMDTRDKLDKTKHITNYFKKHGIAYKREALDTGDYKNTENPFILIERKQNLLEIASNIVNDHNRFKRELERLDAIGGKMYILIEERYNSLEDIRDWKVPCKKDGTPYLKMSGQTLYKYMMSWKYKHNIEFVFCHKKDTAKKILELLEVR